MKTRDSVRLGVLNIHGVLSPRKGACNPSQRAIINGETETGVTLHEWTAGVDERPIIDQRRVPLFFADTWQMVFDRIARAADDLIAANLPRIFSGGWVANGRDQRAAKYWRRTPDDGLLSWARPVFLICKHIRALLLLPPLAPALALHGNGQQVSLDRYLAPAELTESKYGSVGGA